jgi:hypothetical protein
MSKPFDMWHSYEHALLPSWPHLTNNKWPTSSSPSLQHLSRLLHDQRTTKERGEWYITLRKFYPPIPTTKKKNYKEINQSLTPYIISNTVFEAQIRRMSPSSCNHKQKKKGRGRVIAWSRPSHTAVTRKRRKWQPFYKQKLFRVIRHSSWF